MPNDDEMYHLRDAVVARVALVMKKALSWACLGYEEATGW